MAVALSNAIGPRARHSDQQPVDGASELHFPLRLHITHSVKDAHLSSLHVLS